MTTKLTPQMTATAVAMATWRRGMRSNGDGRDRKERLDIVEATRKIDFMVDLRRLRALRAVADHGTLAAAAEALHLTPSAVSQQLAALERELGHALLEPAGRSVRLTPAAHVLLGHADTLFAQLERLEGDLAAQDAAPRGEVRVAGLPDRARRPPGVGRAAAARRCAGGHAADRGGRDARGRGDARRSRRRGDPRHGVLGGAAPRRHPLSPRGAARRRARCGPGHRPPAGGPGADRARGAVRPRAGSRRRSAGRATRCSSRVAGPRASAQRSPTARATGRR